MDAFAGRIRSFARGAAAALLLAGALAAPGAGLAGSSDATEPSDPAAIVRRLSGELDLQTKLPGAKPDVKDRREGTPSDFKLRIPGATTILWSALAVGLAFAIWALRDSIPSLRRRAGDGERGAGKAATPDAAAVARMAEAGDDADELARAGRFAEAMHLLLLRALSEMRARLGVTLADSLTSREIARVVALPDGGRGALDELIGRVERVHFGAEPATSDDFRACRGTFERLIGAMLVPQRAAAA